MSVYKMGSKRMNKCVLCIHIDISWVGYPLCIHCY